MRRIPFIPEKQIYLLHWDSGYENPHFSDFFSYLCKCLFSDLIQSVLIVLVTHKGYFIGLKSIFQPKSSSIQKEKIIFKLWVVRFDW